MLYELKLASGRAVVWEGSSPEDAARRLVDARREETVVAWRAYPRTGVFVWGGAPIAEPRR